MMRLHIKVTRFYNTTLCYICLDIQTLPEDRLESISLVTYTKNEEDDKCEGFKNVAFEIVTGKDYLERKK